MKSSAGVHYVALDHIRAFAAFLVFSWHFLHGADGYPVAFEYVPNVVPFALVDEGHTGVALFMTLSGYLFAKLLDGKVIRYRAFLWNRALRLLPLLAVVLAITGVLTFLAGTDVSGYPWLIVRGLLLPTLPNGGWSITIEFHYYLILPVFLWMLARSRWLPLSLVIAAVALRTGLYSETGEVHTLAYWTLVGRLDQFALGMIIYQFRGAFAHRHALFLIILVAYVVFYWFFDGNGGLMQMPTYPSSSPLWIAMPTIEGVAYAIGIAWYDSSFTPSAKGLSGFIARIGEYSYSIYLLHFYVVFQAGTFVHERIMDISNFYVACAWALALFVLMIVPGYLSYRFIEAPFLRMRRPYTIGAPART